MAKNCYGDSAKKIYVVLTEEKAVAKPPKTTEKEKQLVIGRRYSIDDNGGGYLGL